MIWYPEFLLLQPTQTDKPCTMFFATVSTIFTAVFQLFLISCAAGLLVRKKMVTPTQIQSISALTVNIFLPCLIISKIINQFDPQGFKLWWTLPLSGILLILTGTLLAAVLFRQNRAKRHFYPLASMQNAVYIPLPIAKLVFPDQFDTFALYAFLIVFGATPFMWSFGKVLVTGAGQNTAIRWKDYITPPFVTILVSIILVFTGLSRVMPTSVMAAVDMLSQATVPLAIFVLGATLGTISLTDMPSMRDTLVVNGVKFFLTPLLVFIILYSTGLHISMPLFCSLMIIQAASPPATNLILMVKTYGGDSQAVGSMMLISHLVCIFAMPLWLALWQFVTALN